MCSQFTCLSEQHIFSEVGGVSQLVCASLWSRLKYPNNYWMNCRERILIFLTKDHLTIGSQQLADQCTTPIFELYIEWLWGYKKSVNRQTGRQTDGHTDGQMDIRTNGRTVTDGYINTWQNTTYHFCVSSHYKRCPQDNILQWWLTQKRNITWYCTWYNPNQSSDEDNQIWCDTMWTLWMRIKLIR